MGDTKIEYVNAVWNPVTGCTKVSEGCRNCYAERMSRRQAGRNGYPVDDPFRVTLHPDLLNLPRRWRKPRRALVSSMGDLFHPNVPGRFINEVWMVMRNVPHTFLILTKRPQRLLDWTERAAKSKGWPIEEIWRSNVWLGVSVEDQQTADERIPFLLHTPAAVRFVSCEPLLGPVDLTRIAPMDLGGGVVSAGDALAGGLWRKEGRSERYRQVRDDIPSLNWVIVGGETDPGARPMHPDWARGLRDQCQAAGVPFYFKGWGDYRPVGWVHGGSTGVLLRPDGHVCRSREELAATHNFEMLRTGKKASGRLLDGREWNELPQGAQGADD